MRDYAGERTVRFPDGVPAAGYLTATFVDSEVYRMSSTTGGATTFGGPETLGIAKAMASVPMLKGITGGADYDRFTPAKQRTIAMRLIYGPNLVQTKALTDNEVGSGPALTYAQLPAEFRKAVDEMAKMGAGLGDLFKPKIKP